MNPQKSSNQTLSCQQTTANDVLEFESKLHIKDKSLSAPQILFSLIVFMELNFLEFDDILNCMKVLKAKKVELSSSKFFSSVE